MKKLMFSIALVLLMQFSYAQKVIRERVHSAKMNKDVPVLVILPDSVINGTYPSVYILHGFSGNPERTLAQDIPDLAKKAKAYQTIYIIPDGNFSSWYVDSPIDKSSQYQTFIDKELLQYIDAKYPTIKKRESRGILGWSMGGYGALHIGLQNSPLYSVVGSVCGALDFTQFGPYYEQFKVDKVLGSSQQLDPAYLLFQKDRGMSNTNQKIILDCGTEDMLIQMNRDFHQYLTKNNIDHLYMESMGKHDTAYWSRGLSLQLLLFNQYLQK